MKRVSVMAGVRLVALVLAVAVVGAACGDDAATTDDLPLVVVTTTILGDITLNITGDAATVVVLMPIGADPHSYEASARQGAQLREADLIIANGVELEEGLLGVIAEAEGDGTRVLAIGDLLDPAPFTRPDGDDDEAGSAGTGQEHGLDPHVWMDPIRMMQGVAVIGEALEPLIGEAAVVNSETYRAEIQALSDEIEAAIGTIPAERRVLVTNHFAYGYYADRYGLEMLGTVIPAATTVAETSAAGFADLVALIESEGVPAIFGSTTEPVDLAKAIASDVGFPVQVIQLYTGSLGPESSGAETYIDMMRTSTNRIVEALTG